MEYNVCVLLQPTVLCVYYYIPLGNHTKICKSNIETSTRPSSIAVSSHSCVADCNPPFNEYGPHAPNSHLWSELLQLAFPRLILPSPNYPSHRKQSDLSERALAKSSLPSKAFNLRAYVFCHQLQTTNCRDREETADCWVLGRIGREVGSNRNTMGRCNCSVA